MSVSRAQVVLAMFAGWLACFVCTATGVFSARPGGFGHASRTDLHTYVLTESPWFRVPYPGAARASSHAYTHTVQQHTHTLNRYSYSIHLVHVQ